MNRPILPFFLLNLLKIEQHRLSFSGHLIQIKNTHIITCICFFFSVYSIHINEWNDIWIAPCKFSELYLELFFVSYLLNNPYKGNKP